MRKAFIIAIACLILAGIGSLWSLNAISENRENVVFTCSEQSGDRSALNGLKIVFDNYGGYLNVKWHTVLSFDEKDLHSETDVEYISSYGLQDRNTEYENAICTLGVAERDLILSQAVQEFLASGTPGTYREKDLWLKDVIDYYPIECWCSFMVVPEGSGPRAEYYNDNTIGNMSIDEYTRKNLTEFFHIPVMENDYITVSTTDGHAYGVDYPADSDSFSLDTFSTSSDRDIYLYVTGYTVKDGYMDIPTGKGIYRLPYGYVAEDNYKGTSRFEGMDIREQEIELIHRMDVGDEVHFLKYSPVIDGIILIVRTGEDGDFLLRVLNTDGSVRQQFVLDNSEKHAIDFYICDRFCVADIYEGRTYVYSYTAGGELKEEVNVDNRVITAAKDGRWQGFRYFYDGERFVMIAAHQFESSFHITVFMNNEFVYQGEYTSNLETRASIYQPDDITVSWK
ncbi:MAG: hypothetical protein IJI05_03175 [Erysipelotrichaceae bacterium]|nr:hypothetical protein [Erysipelotrichaceae bacterium]